MSHLFANFASNYVFRFIILLVLTMATENGAAEARLGTEAPKNPNKYIAVMYKLHIVDQGERQDLVEETGEGDPFIFVSGLGMTLDAFEAQIVPLKAGDTFDFTLTPDDAYGEYEASGRIALPRTAFSEDGKLDSRYIYRGAVVPLNTPDDARFNAIVVDITEETVTVDLNHPLAGKSLNFAGSVVETREATGQEVRDALNQITGCGGECGSCGGCGSRGGCNGCGGGGCR